MNFYASLLDSLPVVPLYSFPSFVTPGNDIISCNSWFLLRLPVIRIFLLSRYLWINVSLLSFFYYALSYLSLLQLVYIAIYSYFLTLFSVHVISPLFHHLSSLYCNCLNFSSLLFPRVFLIFFSVILPTLRCPLPVSSPLVISRSSPFLSSLQLFNFLLLAVYITFCSCSTITLIVLLYPLLVPSFYLFLFFGY